MATWKGARFGGVDGHDIPENFLVAEQLSYDYSSSKLLDICKELGMDCSAENPVFYHADLGPTNIIVEDVPVSGAVGIIDFEIAGYFPRDWVKTKFPLSSGMDLTPEAASEDQERLWWRRECVKLLGESGFEDVLDAWWK
jgi:hypothetical protein